MLSSLATKNYGFRQLHISQHDILIGPQQWVYDVTSPVGASSGDPHETVGLSGRQKSDSVGSQLGCRVG